MAVFEAEAEDAIVAYGVSACAATARADRVRASVGAIIARLNLVNAAAPSLAAAPSVSTQAGSVWRSVVSMETCSNQS